MTFLSVLCCWMEWSCWTSFSFSIHFPLNPKKHCLMKRGSCLYVLQCFSAPCGSVGMQIYGRCFRSQDQVAEGTKWDAYFEYSENSGCPGAWYREKNWGKLSRQWIMLIALLCRYLEVAWRLLCPAMLLYCELTWKHYCYWKRLGRLLHCKKHDLILPCNFMQT